MSFSGLLLRSKVRMFDPAKYIDGGRQPTPHFPRHVRFTPNSGREMRGDVLFLTDCWPTPECDRSTMNSFGGIVRRVSSCTQREVDRTTYPPKMRKSLPLAKSTKRRLTPLAIGCPFRGLSRSKKPNGVGLTTLNSFASVQNGFFDRAEGRIESIRLL